MRRVIVYVVTIFLLYGGICCKLGVVELDSFRLGYSLGERRGVSVRLLISRI